MTDKIRVINPATGELVEELRVHTAEEVETRIEKVAAGFNKWKKINAHERARLLKRWSAKIQEQKEAIARIMTLESGKPIKESLGEVDYATSYIDWYAE